jgi:hypothetical protein
VLIFVQGDAVDGSFPVDVLVKSIERGGALTPDEYVFSSVSSTLIENQHAL